MTCNGMWIFCSLSALLTGAMCCPSPASAAEPKLEYNRDIRPILAENCFQCHGADSAARKADLRLDQREAAIEMKSIVAGQPDESELMRRMLSSDADEIMPPPATKKTLTDAQKETLRRWIAEGAEYQTHWSLIAPTRLDPPAVKQSDWVRTPIDNFILARLEAAGLSPAPEVDRSTLARRVSLDLTGMPPEPTLVESFVNDTSPEAYEKLVDTLLASPQWGEHRGRYWLDAARYGDTHGINLDNFREMWTYRDWVIGAFNRNLPFDQFTIEQLAGDMLPGATLEQKIATGFNRCNITTSEKGIIDEEYEVLYARDRTETVATVWMGLTVGCAVCHDHKFDPIAQREYYELSAFFNNTTQAVMDGNGKGTPPFVLVPLSGDRERIAALEVEIPAAEKAVEARHTAMRSTFDNWLAAARPELFGSQITTAKLALHAPLSEGTGQALQATIASRGIVTPLANGAKWLPAEEERWGLTPQGVAATLPEVGKFEKDQPYTCAVWVKLPAKNGAGEICARMTDGRPYRGWDFCFKHRQIGMHITHNWPKDALNVMAKAQVPADKWTHVAVSYDGSAKASGVKVYYDGQPQETVVVADCLTSTIQTEDPFRIGHKGAASPQRCASLQDLRVYTRALAPAEVTTLTKTSQFAGIMSKWPIQRTKTELNHLYTWWLGKHDKVFADLSQQLAKLEQEQSDIQARRSIAHVMNEKDQAAVAFILNRGEYDQRRDEVKALTPAALPPFPDSYSHNRLGLAKWLLLPEHPLTTRVTVNRFWQEVFGQGLVRTPGDFGVMGEFPSHPALLDWLAVDFRENNWDVKRFFKQIVMSATYRQQSLTTPEKLEQDVHNVLLSRGPRFRMDAEMIRDSALVTSGLLVQKVGGPSVKPYQPSGVWEAVARLNSNTHDYTQDSGESLYRRSLYTFWKRTAPPASMDIFNAPSREVCTVQRERTDTPLQALVTLNDPQFVEAARMLAQRAIQEGGVEAHARADFIMLRLASRTLTDREWAVVEASLADLSLFYIDQPEEAKKLIAVGETPADPAIDTSTLAARTMLTNELMNLDEVLNK